MADRLANLRVVDPVLTELARGYSNTELVGDALMPIAMMEKEAGKIPQFGKEAFKLYNTERAIRARSNRVSPEAIGTIDVALDEHDLEYPIDYREDQEAMFPLQSHAATVTKSGVMLRREKMIADLCQTAGNYPAGSKVTLAGTSQFSNAASDPVAVIEAAKEAVRGKIAHRPNTMVMGAATFSVLKTNPKMVESIKYSMKGIITLDLMKELFGIANIVVGEAVWSSDTGTFADIWGDNVILAYVPGVQSNAERSLYEPSFGYTLRKRGQPMVDTYTEGNKLQLIRYTDIFKPVMVGAEAGYLISDTNA